MEEMSFQVSLENWQGSSIPDEGGKFIPPARNGEWKRSGKWLSLSVMAPQGVSHSHISGFWRGCRLSSVSGSRRVLSLWLFYMQASVSWTWCELQPGASAARLLRGVTWAILGSLKTSHAAAFWIRWHINDSLIVLFSFFVQLFQDHMYNFCHWCYLL